ncbi:hypothetical protein BURKHO8Y_350005 [Burkholderia sp. 8Y]|nr:hypothetical protein BURKHO8Y_350005 [Burkholderia sp. 8Y]
MRSSRPWAAGPDEEGYHPELIEQRQLAGTNEYTVTDIENAINYWRSRSLFAQERGYWRTCMDR